MDIKTRIDALSEAEAKEILEKLIGSVSVLHYVTSDTEMTLDEIENYVFDEALKLMEREAEK